MREIQTFSDDRNNPVIKGKFDPVLSGLTFITVWNISTSTIEMPLAKFFQKLHITPEDCKRAFDEIP